MELSWKLRNIHEHLIFDKAVKIIQWGKNHLQQMVHNWMLVCRRQQIDLYLSPRTKLKSKWIKHLNINPATLNLLEEKVGGDLGQIGTGDGSLNITPVVQTLRSTINKWDLLKLRSFCKAKNTVDKTKQQPTEWEKIFTNPTSDRGLISKYTKNSRS